MEKFVGLNINEIMIIVEKFEKEEFNFVNPQREFDGFVMILSGEGYVIDPQGKRRAVKSGEILLLRKDDKYEIHLKADCSYITSAYTIGFDGGEEYIQSLPFILELTDKQIQKIKKICSVWQSRKWDSYTLCRVELLKFYLDIMGQTIKTLDKDDDVLCATEYIHKNFKRNFSGMEIADACSVSISHLRTKFLRQTGQTIISYRDNLRIIAAKEMLESGIFSATEIAAELGYCDIYHFSKVFKKYVGVSPTEYNK